MTWMFLPCIISWWTRTSRPIRTVIVIDRDLLLAVVTTTTAAVIGGLLPVLEGPADWFPKAIGVSIAVSFWK